MIGGETHTPFEAGAHYITLGELQQMVRQTIDERFALPLWVCAEIAEIKVNQSGHCYLSLIEKREGDGLPAAQARAVIWRSHYPRLAAWFEAASGTPLAVGIRLLAKVHVTYHELYGFSLQITDIDPSYTLGDLERQRRETIARLQADGVWEMNRELPLPMPVQRVAVVSSAQAAGYQDFCQELARSPYRFRVELFEAFMQGRAAEESIVAALCAVAGRQEEFDAVVLIRGGGSRNDLVCFDAYRLCSHVAQFPLPVLTGIGHDKDTSVADLVAAVALKTPTAVAGWLVDRMAEAVAALDAAARELRELSRERMQREALQLTREAAELRQSASQLVAGHRLRMERISGEVRRLSTAVIESRKATVKHLAAELPAAVRGFMERRGARLAAAADLVAARSPERILRLGFAVVRSGGTARTSVRGVNPGDLLEVELADGRLTATVRDRSPR